MAQHPSLTLYTIGHSDRNPDEFLDHLKQHGVTVLVDVRSLPHSRRVPHFSKNPLRALLHEGGIGYSYAGDKLGGRPDDPALYHHPPDESTRRETYLRDVNYEVVMRQPRYREAITRLLDIVAETVQQGGQVALLCSEGDPRRCHRHYLIARSLITEDDRLRVTDRAVTIRHIRRDGTLETALDASVEFPIMPQQQQLL